MLLRNLFSYSRVGRTNCEDKSALRQVHDIYKRKVEKETALDTDRVKDHPKRIIVFMAVKHISLGFKGIEEMTNITYLENILKRLTDPRSTTALEQEVIDIIKARLEVLEVQCAVQAQAERREKAAQEKSRIEQARRK